MSKEHLVLYAYTTTDFRWQVCRSRYLEPAHYFWKSARDSDGEQSRRAPHLPDALLLLKNDKGKALVCRRTISFGSEIMFDGVVMGAKCGPVTTTTTGALFGPFHFRNQ